MIEKNIMEDFLLNCTNEGILDMKHILCRQVLRDRKQRVEIPINLREAYEAAENHLLNLCPGSHSNE